MDVIKFVVGLNYVTGSTSNTHYLPIPDLGVASTTKPNLTSVIIVILLMICSLDCDVVRLYMSRADSEEQL
jgi:hypothetical protein